MVQFSTETRRDITLNVGLFFDGSGNNAFNTGEMIKILDNKGEDIAALHAQATMEKVAAEQFGIAGTAAISHCGYYTNIHWLNTLYYSSALPENGLWQYPLYIEGCGTADGQPDSLTGLVFGIDRSGVIAKINQALLRLTPLIRHAMAQLRRSGTEPLVLKNIRFDIFGFSRGAAAARHFACMARARESALIDAIQQGLGTMNSGEMPAISNRFIGLFDTVAAMGFPEAGLDRQNTHTGGLHLALGPGVAENVFQIAAMHECRYNFPLQSVTPLWPELALPGVHADIGGGYLPLIAEDVYLTRPATETVPLSQPGEQTRGYQQVMRQRQAMSAFPAIAPLLRVSKVSAQTWYDDRMPADRYGRLQKRSFAALRLSDRVVKHHWSKVALRVMIDAAQAAGVSFNAAGLDTPELRLPPELTPLCDNAISQGKAARAGGAVLPFSQAETDFLAQQYLHCSANWNAVTLNSQGQLQGGAALTESIGFINRPDERWQRRVY